LNFYTKEIRLAWPGKSATLRSIDPLKTLHKYLVSQVLATLLLTVSVFAFVVLLLSVLKDVLPLLFAGHIGFWLLLKAVGLLLPFACIYALPMGFITATLLVFGRFSADQELTAARAGGVSLLSLVSPILILSLLCCGLCAWFNMDLGPRSRSAFVELKTDAIADLANQQVPEGQFIRDFPGYIFYTEKNNNGNLENVSIYQLKDKTNAAESIIQAAHGRFNPNRGEKQLVIELSDVRVLNIDASNAVNSINLSETSINLSSEPVTNHVYKPKISDMTFPQLRQELHDLQTLSLPGRGTNTLAILKTQLRLLQQQKKDFAEPVLVVMHQQVAFSFACFGFTLIGIPLGIRVHRRETNIGILMALILVIVYYAFILLGQSLSGHPEFFPHLILWVPNLIFQAVGAVLLWRANRGI
jgi:lipopolysaccharide export system permease protein